VRANFLSKFWFDHALRRGIFFLLELSKELVSARDFPFFAPDFSLKDS
jgi:hypothetical protein